MARFLFKVGRAWAVLKARLCSDARPIHCIPIPSSVPENEQNNQTSVVSSDVSLLDIVGHLTGYKGCMFSQSNLCLAH